MTHIAVIAPFWQRDMTTALFFAHMAAHASLCEKHGISLRLIAVGSEGEASREMAGLWSDYVEFENQPLGAKFNAGFRAARDFEPDYVMTMGSDTFFLPQTWEYINRGIASGHDMAGFLDVHMYDTETRKAVYWPGYRGTRQGETIGPLRMVSRAVMDYVNWEPYDGTRRRSLDASMMHKLAGRDTPVYAMTGGSDCMIVSVKEKDSLTKMEWFDNVRPVPRSAVLSVLAQFH